MPPANAYIISCIPWFTFNSFSLHNHGIKDYYVPSFEAGGFAETAGGKLNMPLSVTVHHAVTDGYHLKVFLRSCKDDGLSRRVAVAVFGYEGIWSKNSEGKICMKCFFYMTV